MPHEAGLDNVVRVSWKERVRAATMRAAHCRGRDERVGKFGVNEPKSKDLTRCRVRNP